MDKRIQDYKDKYLLFKECTNSRVKDKRLSLLMTEMEREFNIPAFNDVEYNKSHPVVMALYISNARVF